MMAARPWVLWRRLLAPREGPCSGAASCYLQPLLVSCRQPATAKWYDTRDFVCIEFCVADSKEVKVSFAKKKCGFRWVGLQQSAVLGWTPVADGVPLNRSTASFCSQLR